MHLQMYCIEQEEGSVETLDDMFSGLLEEKVWTTLKNNMSPQTSVTSAGKEGKAVLQITYNVTDEQVHNDGTRSWT